MGEVAPLGDGEGRKNIKFHYFFGQSRTPVPTLMRFVRILGERTYFVGVGAHDDPKTINNRNTLVEPAMCAKIFQYESFCGAFFKKRP